MRQLITPILILLSFSLSALLAGTALGDDDRRQPFVRLPAEAPSGSGNSVRYDCGGDFPEARASLRWAQEDGRTRLRIHLSNGRPNTLYTVWLRLKGTDRDGWAFGGSPITGGGSTPLAPSTALEELLAATGPGNGSPTPPNGFWTNRRGRGRMVLNLDFAFPAGAYPFDRADLSEEALSDLAVLFPEYRLIPTALVDANVSEAPFTLRLASHCTDDLSHGLTPGAREGWFDWPI
ncbi:MAG: hypothetical protein P8Q97_18410 [Myxococcota bacterium]|jgi:hypothetical protein|nr:hypothetical protein [Myxococcota bacterium]